MNCPNCGHKIPPATRRKAAPKPGPFGGASYIDGLVSDTRYREWRQSEGLPPFESRPECVAQWNYGKPARFGGVKASPDAAHYLALPHTEEAVAA